MTTNFWDVDASGDWGTAADWNLGRLPNSTDDVSINTAHRHTVTHSIGTSTVNTLAVGNDYFKVTGGSLTILSTSNFDHQVTVSAGTLSFGGAATLVHLVQNGGVISGEGTATVTASGGPTSFTNTLLQMGSGRTVLQGASNFSGSGEVCLDGGRTLENAGTITLSGTEGLHLAFNPFGPSLGGGTLVTTAGATI
ncbi:MAG: hypothetical protein ACR2FH_01770, partial [Caulobacteraceae bacterium]